MSSGGQDIYTTQRLNHEAEIRQKDAEIERLRAPMRKCDLVDNEVTGLHNEADLRRISELQHVLESVSCEFEKGTWQRRDIDEAIKGDE